MSLIRVSKSNPCPICGKPDWCSISSDGAKAICMRQEYGSKILTKNNGYLHILHDDIPYNRKRTITSSSTPIYKDFTKLAKCYHQEILNHPERLHALAQKLCIPESTLLQLRIGWSKEKGAYSFPMRSASRQVIGIQLQYLDRRKLSVKGSKLGLFIPYSLEETERLYITEGASDCAAFLSLGIDAIGRASCNSCVEAIRDICKTPSLRQLVIVADADAQGRRGACVLATALCLYSEARVIYPPDGIKDAREWVTSGATREEIEEVVRNTEPVAISYRRRGNYGESGD